MDQLGGLTLEKTPPQTRQVAMWVATTYAESGTWPTNNAVAVHCFQAKVERALFVGQRNDVFRPINDAGGSGPARTGLSNWALCDTGACKEAFSILEAVVRDAITDILSAQDGVTYSRTQVKDRWARQASEQTLVQIEHILETSALAINRSPDHEWSVTFGIHILDRPSFERLVLNRPTTPIADFQPAVALGTFDGGQTAKPGAAYDEKGDLLQLGGWRTVRSLPGGGQGEVWVVFRETDSLVGVLKRARRDRTDHKRIERLRREGQFLKSLNELRHPCIITLLDSSSSSEEDPWLVTEFLQLGSIQDHLDVFRGDVWRTLRIVRDIASAVAASHAANITHRDLKPANVLLRTLDTVALTDFGVGFDPALEPLTTTGAEAVHSRWFSPPEATEKRLVTHAWDVFMLGRLLYFVVTGGRYFDGDRPEGKSALDTLLDRDDLRGLSTLIEKMVRPDASDRIPDMPAVIREIDALLTGRARPGFGDRCVRCESGQYAELGQVVGLSQIAVGISAPGGTGILNPFEFQPEWRGCPKCGDVQLRMRALDRFRMYVKV